MRVTLDGPAGWVRGEIIDYYIRSPKRLQCSTVARASIFHDQLKIYLLKDTNLNFLQKMVYRESLGYKGSPWSSCRVMCLAVHLSISVSFWLKWAAKIKISLLGPHHLQISAQLRIWEVIWSKGSTRKRDNIWQVCIGLANSNSARIYKVLKRTSSTDKRGHLSV